MKNTKIKIMVLAFTIMLTITLNVIYALTETTTLSCTPTSATAGGIVNCTLNTSITDGSISGVQGTIILSDGLELVSCTKDSSWEGNCNNGIIGLYTDLNKTGGNTLLSFVVSVKSDTVRGNQTISISDFAYSDASFNLVSSSVSQSTILIKSTTNTLSSLSVTGLTLSPAFSSNTTTYSASTNDASATVNATLTDNNSLFVDGYGPRTVVNLNYGNNPVLIKVNSESGSTKTYTINITRNDTRSEVNTMATLVPSIGALSPAFSSNTTNYTMNVNQTVNTITFTGTLTDSKSEFVEGYRPGSPINLEMGVNTITFKVKSEKGTERTYTVTVTKVDTRSEINTMATLVPSIGTLSPAFSSNTSNYTMSVGYYTNSITFTGTLTDSKSEFVDEYDPRTINLQMGVNTITFKVKSEKGTERTYTIVVKKTDTRSEINTMATLVPSAGTLSPAFSSNTSNYTMSVGYYTNSITFTGTLTDSKSEFVSGNGHRTVNLQMGVNTITFKVKSEKGTERTYTIVVKKTDTRSEINTIKVLLLSVGDLSPVFSPTTTNYKVNVNQTVESINFGASLTDSKSSFVASYGPRRVNLKFGSNTILFKAKSEKGTEITYTIVVNKAYQKSDNANLSAITLSSGSIAFKSDTLKYNVSVPYNVSTIQIGAVKANSAARVEGTGSKTLNVGSNSFDLKVTAESGVIKKYTVVIERQAEPAAPVTLDNDNTLKSLVITGEKLDFKSTILKYNVTIAYDINELSISAIPTSSKAKVNIMGNENLEDKSIIQIVVTAENSENKIYELNIIKEERSVIIEDPSSSTIPIVDDDPIVVDEPVDRNKSFVIIALYCVLAIGLSCVIIYKRRKK